jgi:hypothetical protein
MQSTWRTRADRERTHGRETTERESAPLPPSLAPSALVGGSPTPHAPLVCRRPGQLAEGDRPYFFVIYSSVLHLCTVRQHVAGRISARACLDGWLLRNDTACCLQSLHYLALASAALVTDHIPIWPSIPARLCQQIHILSSLFS